MSRDVAERPAAGLRPRRVLASRRGGHRDRLLRILRSRRIRGVIIVGMMNENGCPIPFDQSGKISPASSPASAPAIPRCLLPARITISSQCARWSRALALGYKRPGLVLDQVIDHLVEGASLRDISSPSRRSLARDAWLHFITPPNRTKTQSSFGTGWRRKNRMSFFPSIISWPGGLLPSVFASPRISAHSDGVATGPSDWAGMHQHNDIVGEAAVGMVIEMIHNNEIVPRPSPKPR